MRTRPSLTPQARLRRALFISATALLAGCHRAPTVASASAPSAGAPPAASAAAVVAVTAASASPPGPLPAGAPWGVTSGMSYPEARKQLIRHGFTPVAIQHADNASPDAPSDATLPDAALMKIFPEADDCEDGGCDFVFIAPATRACLLVDTSGPDPQTQPGGGMSVVALDPCAFTQLHAGPAPSAEDVDGTGGDNILLAFTPSVRNDAVIDDLNQGPGRLFEPGGENGVPAIGFDGAAYLKRLYQAGYVSKGFKHEEGEDDERVELTNAATGAVIKIYLQGWLRDQSWSAGSSLIRIEAGGKTYADDALVAYLAPQQLSHALPQ